MEKPNPILHIGILGAANIARKNIKAIQHRFNNGQCELVAIASRSKEKAIQFTAAHVDNTSSSSPITLYTGPNAYDQLIRDDSIDALYIPLPTKLHLEYVKQSFIHGKHVLIEKPVASNYAEYQEMIHFAKQANKCLMDGTMFVHNPRTMQVVNRCNKSNHAAITRIQSDFTFLGDDDFFTNNIRVQKNGDLHGCIGDLGWYCIRMAQLVYNPPNADATRSSSVAAKCVQTVHYELKDGVPIDATCLVEFECNDYGGRNTILSFHCSFLHPLNQRITMFGAEETIQMDDFVIPRQENDILSFETTNQMLSHADLYSIHSSNVIGSKQTNPDEPYHNPPQEVLMWNNFTKFCHGYDINDENIQEAAKSLLNISLENQLIVDALMESIRQDGKKVLISSIQNK